MRIAILQNSEDTPPGTLLNWIELRGHSHVTVKVWETTELPDLSEVDWIVVLGGPMNVDETDRYPWLKVEKTYLSRAIREKRHCLGLCLGGQLLAQALGAKVVRHRHKEIGWHPVEIEGGRAKINMFHWHEDTFDLPPGARLIASNEATLNQGFAFGEEIVGVQFHPEATEAWVRSCAEEIAAGGEAASRDRYVQSPRQMIEGLDQLEPMRKWFFDWLDELASKIKRP